MAPVGSVPAANPRTYIESGAVASDISGASDAPTIEPVAKITAEFAPVSACAAASLQFFQRLDIAYAPFAIAFSQACVKHLVADSCVLAAALEWAVQEQPPILLQVAPGACEQAFGNAPGRYMDHVSAEHCQ